MVFNQIINTLELKCSKELYKLDNSNFLVPEKIYTPDDIFRPHSKRIKRQLVLHSKVGVHFKLVSLRKECITLQKHVNFI